MAIDFSEKILVTSPTVHSLGRYVVFLGIIAIAVAAVTYFAGDFLMPPLAWAAMAVPTIVVGTILMFCGLTKP